MNQVRDSRKDIKVYFSLKLWQEVGDDTFPGARSAILELVDYYKNIQLQLVQYNSNFKDELLDGVLKMVLLAIITIYYIDIRSWKLQ